MSFGSLLNNHLRTPFYGFEDLLNTKFESEVYMEGLANEGLMGAVCEIAIEFEGVIRDFQGSSLASSILGLSWSVQLTRQSCMLYGEVLKNWSLHPQGGYLEGDSKVVTRWIEEELLLRGLWMRVEVH